MSDSKRYQTYERDIEDSEVKKCFLFHTRQEKVYEMDFAFFYILPVAEFDTQFSLHVVCGQFLGRISNDGMDLYSNLCCTYFYTEHYIHMYT